MSVYIGIDPGGSGGVVALRSDATWRGDLAFNGASDTDVLAFLREMATTGDGMVHAVIERVSSSPQMGVSSAFTFGRSYGALLMAIVAAGIPFDAVVPRKWQPAVGVIYPKASTQTQRKNVSKQRAQELFPSVKVTHAIADALLIAEFCRRTHTLRMETA